MSYPSDKNSNHNNIQVWTMQKGWKGNSSTRNCGWLIEYHGTIQSCDLQKERSGAMVDNYNTHTYTQNRRLLPKLQEMKTPSKTAEVWFILQHFHIMHWVMMMLQSLPWIGISLVVCSWVPLTGGVSTKCEQQRTGKFFFNLKIIWSIYLILKKYVTLPTNCSRDCNATGP